MAENERSGTSLKCLTIVESCGKTLLHGSLCG